MPILSPNFDAPVHGFRGDSAADGLLRPAGLTVAISRESGARGGSIARRVGERLGWQVFDQEFLWYQSTNVAARTQFLDDIPEAARGWVDAQFEQLRQDRRTVDSTDQDTVRLILQVAARGEAVIVGRGAGMLLPAATTLNVRIVAPLDQRIAYMRQWLRMSDDQAAAEVALRDRARSALYRRLSGHDAGELAQYDLALNSGRLPETAVADLIVAALKAKHLAVDVDLDPPSSTHLEPVG